MVSLKQTSHGCRVHVLGFLGFLLNWQLFFKGQQIKSIRLPDWLRCSLFRKSWNAKFRPRLRALMAEIGRKQNFLNVHPRMWKFVNGKGEKCFFPGCPRGGGGGEAPSTPSPLRTALRQFLPLEKTALGAASGFWGEGLSQNPKSFWKQRFLRETNLFLRFCPIPVDTIPIPPPELFWPQPLPSGLCSQQTGSFTHAYWRLVVCF